MVSKNTSGELPPGWKEHVKVNNGRKFKFYTSVATGQKFYSKKNVIRYVMSRDGHQGTSPSLSGPDNERSLSIIPANPIVEKMNDSSEWLPHGWIVETRIRKGGSSRGSIYKIYIQRSTGLKLYSKPQVMKYLESTNLNSAAGKQNNLQQIIGGSSPKQDMSHHCESVEGKSSIPREEKNDNGKPSLNIAMEERNRLDELPPGWIKEYKTRKYVNGIKKDPYYTDPVSGYVFRSKKDAFRYLETGDIGSCAMKPQKRDISELRLIMDGTHSQPQPDGKKLGQSVQKLLSTGHKSENGNTSSHTGIMSAAEAERSQGKEDGITPIGAKFTSSRLSVKEMHFLSEAIVFDKSGESSEPKTEGSKQDAKVIDDNGAISHSVNPGSHEQKLPENGLDTEIQIDLRKSKKRKLLIMPGRSSKRLAGSEPEMSLVKGFSERALRAAIKKPRGIEGNRSSSLILNDAASEVPQQLHANVETVEVDRSSSLGLNFAAAEVPQQHDANVETVEANRSSNLGLNFAASEVNQQPDTNGETEFVNHTSVSAEASLETDLGNNTIMQSEGQGVPKETAGQVNERENEEDPRLQGDYWSDPCFDFAFKTLIGEIPIEDTLALQACLQPQTSYREGDVSLEPQAVDIPAFQNDVRNHLGSVQNNVLADQLPNNRASPPLANNSLPGCSSLGSQPPRLEARRKDYQTKVKS